MNEKYDSMDDEIINITQHNIRITFRVTPDEFECIRQKQDITNYKSISAYVRRAAVFGKLYLVDTKRLSEMNKMLSGIRGSLNQIAKRVNSTDRIYDDDLKAISEINKNIDEITREIIDMKTKIGMK